MGANALSVYLESRILAADRVELVQILYQTAIESVENARRHLRERNIAARAREINKALCILSELTTSLNHAEGGAFSSTTHALYDYMMRRLIEANQQQAEPPLAEVAGLLSTVLEGWMHCKPAADAPLFEASPAVPVPAPEQPIVAAATEPEPAYREYRSYIPAAPAPPAMPPEPSQWNPYASVYAASAYRAAAPVPPAYLPIDEFADAAGPSRFAMSY